jgi:phosphoribosylaminoimidazolecarboxamide formyltransferase/IMP cyclohydrolase
MLNGRVKTLHPMIHGGLLGDRNNPEHVRQMSESGMVGIDLLVVNLYAFEATVTSPHELQDAIESIDIGGPAMIRAAAKNHANVAVVVDPEDYAMVLAALKEQRLAEMRAQLAAKAFRHTAYYDSVIARYLTTAAGVDPLTETYTLGYRRKQAFRYGENMHQAGALYIDPLGTSGIAQCEKLWGADLSYNNLTDAQGAWELVCDLPSSGCAIIKHANPCGAAVDESLGSAYELARETDPISAFGGIVAFNRPVERSTAEAMTAKGNFLEVVIAPDYSEEAIEVFKNRAGWGQNVRLLRAPLVPPAKELTIKWIRGGAVVQESDEDPGNRWRVVSEAQPSDELLAAMRLQWTIVQHVKSNAITVGNAARLLGVGAGQMNRVNSVRLALAQAGEGAHGAALASDAFFPFPDSVEQAAAGGIAALVQPGGSKKDEEVIEAANRLGLVMVFTGTRHFQH